MPPPARQSWLCSYEVNQVSTPPCLEQVPLRVFDFEYVPSLHLAVDPAGAPAAVADVVAAGAALVAVALVAAGAGVAALAAGAAGAGVAAAGAAAGAAAAAFLFTPP